jgi:DNA-binding CsgD family transcriptional regulator/PAS domain-containing protein
MSARITAERLSMLVERIYMCATNPALWPATLRLVNDSMACSHATLGIVCFPERRTLLQASSGFDDGFFERYRGSLERVERIWGGAAAIAEFPMDEPVILSRVRPSALDPGDEDYEFLCELLGFDVDDTLNLPLVHVGEAIGTAAFARKSGAGTFDARACSFFRMLSPHMRRSSEINALLEASTITLNALDSLFDRLNAPVFVADHNGRLLHSNQAAERLLLGGVIRTLADGKTLCSALLKRAVSSVASGRSQTRHELVIEQSSTDAESWTFHVIGLYERDRVSQVELVAIVGTPITNADTQLLRPLARTKGLTESETSVLAYLLLGNSTHDIAALLGIERSTVRTHLLHLYDKLEVHGRAQLIAKIHSMIPPFRPDDQIVS